MQSQKSLRSIWHRRAKSWYESMRNIFSNHLHNPIFLNFLDLSSWQVEVPVVEDRPPFRYKVKNLYGVFDIAEPNHSMSLLGTYFQIILKTPILSEFPRSELLACSGSCGRRSTSIQMQSQKSLRSIWHRRAKSWYESMRNIFSNHLHNPIFLNFLDLSSWQVEVPVVEDRPPFRYKVKNLYGAFDIAKPNHSMSLLGTYFQIILKTPILSEFPRSELLAGSGSCGRRSTSIQIQSQKSLRSIWHRRAKSWYEFWGSNFHIIFKLRFFLLLLLYDLYRFFLWCIQAFQMEN